MDCDLPHNGSQGCRRNLHCVLRLRGGGDVAASDEISDDGSRSEVELDVAAVSVLISPVRRSTVEVVNGDDCSRIVIDL